MKTKKIKEYYSFRLPYREKTKQPIPHILTLDDIKSLKYQAKMDGRSLHAYIAKIVKDQANV